MIGMVLFSWVYVTVAFFAGVYVLMRILRAGMDKIMFFTWMFIFGVILATVYIIPFDWVAVIFKGVYAGIILYTLTYVLKTEKTFLFSGVIGKIFGAVVSAILLAVLAFLLKPAFSHLSSIAEGIAKIIFVIIALYIIGTVVTTVVSNNAVNIRNVILVIVGILLGMGLYTAHLDTRNPNHIVHFAQDNYGVKSRIVGKVVREPVYKKGRVVYTIKPITIQPNIYENKVVKVAGKGNIYFQASQPLMSHLDIDYGDRVEVVGTLLRPRPANNPGGFDYRAFLLAKGIYAAMYARFPNEKNPPIRKIASFSLQPTFKNVIDFKYQYYSIFNLSLVIKRQILKVIKQTMPFPSSAFLGGITLGLRYGLDGVHFKHAKAVIKQEFKHAGVNHVLAVSGLHVSIIAAMLWAIFSLFRVPLKIQAPIIIFSLIIFTIITGARPATLRATIMNSLVLLTLAYLGQGLRSSLLFGVSVAALLILLFNPILIYQASFTMSFGAILSLGLLTTPVDKLLLKYLVGEGFIAALASLAIMLFIMFAYKANFQINSFYLLLLATSIIIFIAYKFRSRKLDSFAFIKIPRGLGVFIATQFAIAGGMLLPSSYAYFGQYPIAGSFTNFLALPLIGILVPLAMIAGIVAILIPVYGIWLALIISAGNYIFANFFLWLAHIATVLFPYPVTTKWTSFGLLLYYVAVAAFIWWRPLTRIIQKIYYSLTNVYDVEKNKWVFIGLGLLILVGISGLVTYKGKSTHDLKVVVLDVGYAGASYIKFPSGNTVLIDGAFYDKRKGFDSGKRVVAQSLLRDGIQNLSALVLTNPNRQNISGLPFILEHYAIKKIYDSIFNKDMLKVAKNYKETKTKYNNLRKKYMALLEKKLNYATPKVKKKRYTTDEVGDKIEALEILADESDVLDTTTDKMSAEIEDMNSELTDIKSEFLSYFGDDKLVQNVDKWWVQSYIDNYIEYLNIIEAKHIPIFRAEYGAEVYGETVGKKRAELFVLNPRSPRIQGSYSDLTNNGVILKLKYAEFSMLFTGESDDPALNKLVAGSENGDYSLKSTVLMIPNHGSKYAWSEQFLQDVDPKTVILQYGSASKVRGRRFAKVLSSQMKDTLRKYRRFNKNMLFYNTYNDGGVTILTDGIKTKYLCMSDENILAQNKRLKNKLSVPSHKIKDKVIGKLNINTATISDFTKLPRIGYSKARAIVEYRKELGGFTSIDQIMDVKGLGEKTFDKFKDMLSIKDEQAQEIKTEQKTQKSDLY